MSTLVDLLRHRAEISPTRRAYIILPEGEDEAGAWTYGELDRAARAWAVRLFKERASGERALLLFHTGLDFIAAYMGCLYAGVIPVPCYPPGRNRPDRRLATVARDSEARFAIASPQVMESLDRQLKNFPMLAELKWSSASDADARFADEWVMPEITDETLAFLQYTSGSTSSPKGVMVSHRNLLTNLEHLHDGWEHDSESVMVTWLPIFHDMGLIYGALQPLYNGFPCVMMPPAAFLQRPVRWLNAITRYGGTHSAAPNFAFDLCARQIPLHERVALDLSTWKMALNAAEPVREETMRRFLEAFGPQGFRQETFCPGFGLAEATLKVTALSCSALRRVVTVDADALARHRIVEVAACDEKAMPLVGCGSVSGDTRVMIIDPDSMKECAADGIGEIWVVGSIMPLGYWRNPEESERTFRAHTAEGIGPFMRTGDLGFMMHGELFITGRLKDMIIVNGLNHYPQDIELTVQGSHDALRADCSAAFSVEISGEERLVVVQEVERTWLRKFDRDEVVSAIRRAVADEHGISVHAIALLKTGSIAKTSSGKIQRSVCRSGWVSESLDVVGGWKEIQVANPDIALPGAVTRVAIRDWLATRIAEKSGILPVSIDSAASLAQYGIDSVTAIRLSGELSAWLGRDIVPTILYDYPSINELSDYLCGQGGAMLDGNPLKDNAAIAVIGMGCRFPGARNIEEFWKLLDDGVDAITREPKSRATDHSDPMRNDDGAAWGGYLDGVDLFDAEFFGIAPREAESMDPQQRILLETSWAAFEHAGIPVERLAGTRTGVFIGISNSDYSRMLLDANSGRDAYAGTGSALSIAANRISYLWDFRGPSLAIDTACSSSLVSVHMACRNLRSGDCDLALAGGVNLILSPEFTTVFSEARMMALDGRCKTFDASADGYVRGEGCGVVLLKRLSDAERDGDRIFALIAGSAVNQDGRSNGLTAPNGRAQKAVVMDALADAGIGPDELDVIEAHGTGTALGDPIELNTLNEIMISRSDKSRSGEVSSDKTSGDKASDVKQSSDKVRNGKPLIVGSLKTNIGHLESAAGIAGLLKLILALRNESIPRHLHLRNMNPHARIDAARISIPMEKVAWPRNQNRARRGGVSSFGFGGSNAHVIVEEAPLNGMNDIEDVAPRDERGSYPLILSAANESALRMLAEEYRDSLMNQKCEWNDISFTSVMGRSRFDHRLGLAARSASEARERLSEFLRTGASAGICHHASVRKHAGVVFLFSGQGSQYAGMGEELYKTESVFRAAFDRCDEIAQPRLGRSLTEITFGKEHSALNETRFTQPALFALEFALSELWRSWGVIPSAVIGHSVGEYVAACVAGVFTVEDGMELIVERARLMQELAPGGAMMAAMTSEIDIASIIDHWRGELAIASVNGPRNVVLSGPRERIDEARSILESRGVKCSALAVSHAFHSPLMTPMVDSFASVVRKIKYSSPAMPIASNVTGELVASEIASPDYWVRHVTAPVRFADGVASLAKAGQRVFAEIGPHPVLCGMARQSFDDADFLWIGSLHRDKPARDQMVESLAKMHARGVEVEWSAFYHDGVHARVDLPRYPFQRRRHWFSSRKNSRSAEEKTSGNCYRVNWIPKILADSPTVSPEELATELRARTMRDLDAREDSSFAESAHRLEEISLRYILRTFVGMGWTPRVGDSFTSDELSEKLRIAPKYRRLTDRLLTALSRTGILSSGGCARDGGEWKVIGDPWLDRGGASRTDEELLDSAARDSRIGAEVALLARTGPALAQILRGESDPLELIFPNGDLTAATRLYEESPSARLMNTTVQNALREILRRVPRERTFRVLEIGAGTGATARSLLPIIAEHLDAEHRDATIEYVFTDLASSFLTQAKARLSEYPFVTYKLLDIEAPPEAQGWSIGEIGGDLDTRMGFDVVIASHVLHATKDLRATVRNAAALLAPGGMLLLSESVDAAAWVDLVFGLTDGWWRFEDHTIRSDSPLLDSSQWMTLLTENGFDSAATLTPPPENCETLRNYAVIAASRSAVESWHGRWIILADRGGRGAAVADEARKRGVECEVIFADSDGDESGDHHGDGDHETRENAAGSITERCMERLRRVLRDSSPESISGALHFWSLDAPDASKLNSSSLRSGGEFLARSVVEIAKGIESGALAGRPSLMFVTRCAQSVKANDAVSGWAHAILPGMARVIELEHPSARCVTVDLDESADVVSIVMREMGGAYGKGNDGENDISYREGRRFVRRVERAHESSSRKASIHSAATYLITGGLGGFGSAAAKWLVREGARNIVLTGRTGASTPAHLEIVRELEASGARVHIASSSVGDEEAMRKVMTKISGEMPRLRGVIHAAGAPAHGRLADTTSEEIAQVFEAKYAGTWILHEVTRDLELDFFACISSMVAVWGAKEQGVYVGVNHCLDSFVGYRSAAGRKTQTINFGPLRGTGTGATVTDAHGTGALGSSVLGTGVLETLQSGGMLSDAKVREMQRMGVTAWEMTKAAELMGRIIGSSVVQTIAAEIDWSVFKPIHESRRRRPIFERLGEDGADVKERKTSTSTLQPQFLDQSVRSSGRSGIIDRLAAAANGERLEILERWISEEVAGVLGFPPSHEIDPVRGFFEIGMDSLSALDLKNRLEKSLGKSLPSTIVFDHPNVTALRNFLAQNILGWDILGWHTLGYDALGQNIRGTDMSGWKVPGSNTPGRNTPETAAENSKLARNEFDETLSRINTDDELARRLARLESLIGTTRPT